MSAVSVFGRIGIPSNASPMRGRPAQGDVRSGKRGRIRTRPPGPVFRGPPAPDLRVFAGHAAEADEQGLYAFEHAQVVWLTSHRPSGRGSTRICGIQLTGRREEERS